MTGFDRKGVRIESDQAAKICLEIDITGCGNWAKLKTYSVKPGAPVSDDLSQVRAYWVRAVADRDCNATVQFSYE